MITEQNIDQYYNDYCYNNYYKNSTNWDKYYEAMAKKEDIEYQDRIFEEE